MTRRLAQATTAIGLLLAPVWTFAQGAATPRPDPLAVPAAPGAPREGIDIRLSGPPVPAVALPASIEVRAFRVTGLSAIPADEAQAVLAPWLGRSLSPVELQRAVNALTDHLRKRDLPIAQAYIPAQAFADGTVELNVLEGRLGRLRIELSDDLRLSTASAERFTSALQPGALLDGRNLEQSLLLFNDLPGVRVDAALAAGAQPGVVDVLAKVQNDGHPLAASLTLDNAGLRATGELRADANLRLRNPLGIGDLLALRLLSSETGGQKLAALTYGVPINGVGTRVGLRVSEQNYRLGREFAPLQAHGRQSATSLLVSHPLLRRTGRNLYLAASYTELRFSDRQDAVGAEGDSRQRIASLGVTGDFRDALLGGAVTTLQAQAYAGETSLQTPVLVLLDAAPGGLGVAGRYTVWRVRAQRLQAIDAKSSLQISLLAQSASRNLDAGTELAVGGPDAVRAYPAGELFADQGRVVRADYRHSFNLFDSAPTVVSVFYDHANVQINRNPMPADSANKRSFAGYGFGLGQQIGANLTLQAFLAWRTTAQPAGDPDRRPRIWISIAAQM